MNKIKLARIDDRLLHGQVVVNWLPAYNIKTIIIIDDEIASDDFLKEITYTAAPVDRKIYIFDSINASQAIIDMEDQGNVLILTKDIKSLLSLLENDIEICELNIGNLAMSSARKRFFDFLCLNEDEIKTLRYIDDKYITDVYVQMIPNSKKIDFREIQE